MTTVRQRAVAFRAGLVASRLFTKAQIAELRKAFSKGQIAKAQHGLDLSSAQKAVLSAIRVVVRNIHNRPRIAQSPSSAPSLSTKLLARVPANPATLTTAIIGLRTALAKAKEALQEQDPNLIEEAQQQGAQLVAALKAHLTVARRILSNPKAIGEVFDRLRAAVAGEDAAPTTEPAEDGEGAIAEVETPGLTKRVWSWLWPADAPIYRKPLAWIGLAVVVGGVTAGVKSEEE